MKKINSIAVIGAGGIGSWLVSALDKLFVSKEVNPVSIHIVDGDTVEEKNLVRQNFTKEDVGKPKAKAVANRCSYFNRFIPVPEYWFVTDLYNSFDTLFGSSIPDFLFVAVDNGRSRKEILETCRKESIPCIFAANEVVDADAILWIPGDPDPREHAYFKSMFRPVRQSCAENPDIGAPEQSVTGNLGAVYASLYLFSKWLDTDANGLYVRGLTLGSVNDTYLLDERFSPASSQPAP